MVLIVFFNLLNDNSFKLLLKVFLLLLVAIVSLSQEDEKEKIFG